MPEKYSREEAKEHYNNKYEDSDPVKFYYADQSLVSAILSKFDIPSGGRILDIPSGTGRFTHFFKQKGQNAIGVDISKTGVYRASEKYGRPQFIVGDGIALPFEERTFDLVFCHGFSVFNEPDLDNVRPFMEEMISLLRTDGLFLFGKTSSLTDSTTKSKLNPYKSSKSSQNDDDSSRYDHSMESYLSFFSGLENIKIIGAYATLPHLFIPLQQFAFSRVITTVLSRLAANLGLPVRVYIILRRTD